MIQHPTNILRGHVRSLRYFANLKPTIIHWLQLCWSRILIYTLASTFQYINLEFHHHKWWHRSPVNSAQLVFNFYTRIAFREQMFIESSLFHFAQTQWHQLTRMIVKSELRIQDSWNISQLLRGQLWLHLYTDNLHICVRLHKYIYHVQTLQKDLAS